MKILNNEHHRLSSRKLVRITPLQFAQNWITNRRPTPIQSLHSITSILPLTYRRRILTKNYTTYVIFKLRHLLLHINSILSQTFNNIPTPFTPQNRKTHLYYILQHIQTSIPHWQLQYHQRYYKTSNTYHYSLKPFQAELNNSILNNIRVT